MRATITTVLALCLSVHAAVAQTPARSLALKQFHEDYSQPEQPFRIVGNIYYVGAKNISSLLITTADGHILIDTGTIEMVPIVKANVQRLGFKLEDIKIMLSSHAHFDHVQGHATMQRATGAKVFAMRGDAEALSAGKDLSPLHSEGWEPVKVDRILKDGDTVTLGGTTLKALWAPGHTPGCTVWSTSAVENQRSYAFVFMGCNAPNAGVRLIGNPQFPNLVADFTTTLGKLKSLKPDIFVMGHPAEQFAGKLDALHAQTRPHPLEEPGAWAKRIAAIEEDFKKRVATEQSKANQ